MKISDLCEGLTKDPQKMGRGRSLAIEARTDMSGSTLSAKPCIVTQLRGVRLSRAQRRETRGMWSGRTG